MGISQHQRDKVKEACCQPTTDPDTLFRHAGQSRRRLLTFAKGLAEELGLDPETQVLKGPLKERSRADLKVHGKYGGNYRELKDIDRDRILFKSADDMHLFRSMVGPGKNSNPFLSKWSERGIEIVEIDDGFLDRKKSGWVGINIAVKIPLGKGRYHICEIQMMHEDMQTIDRITHENYEAHIRPKTDLAEYEGRDLTPEEMKEIGVFREAGWSMYDGGIVACKLEGLLSPGWLQNLEQRLSGVMTYQKPEDTASPGAHLKLVA